MMVYSFGCRCCVVSEGEDSSCILSVYKSRIIMVYFVFCAWCYCLTSKSEVRPKTSLEKCSASMFAFDEVCSLVVSVGFFLQPGISFPLVAGRDFGVSAKVLFFDPTFFCFVS